MTPEQPDEFRALFRELCQPQRYGWKRSKLCEQQRDYIIGMEAVIRAIHDVQRLSWPMINATDQTQAELIRENTLHALATLVRAMANNEKEILDI